MAKEKEYSPFDAPVKGPVIPYKDRVRNSLEKAVEKESYDDAAVLRDALLKLEKGECLSTQEKTMCDNILFPASPSDDSDNSEYTPFDAPVKNPKY